MTRLAVNEAEAAIYRWLAQHYLDGHGARLCAKALNEKGVPTSRGKQWSGKTVLQILRSPVYAGRMTWEKKRKVRNRLRPNVNPTVVEGACEALIEPERWQAIQRMIDGKNSIQPRALNSTYPLTGLARCGLCGRAVTGASSPRRDRRTGEIRRRERVYRCTNEMNNSLCPLPRVRCEVAEGQFVSAISICISDPQKLESLFPKVEAEEERDAIEQSLSKTRKAIKRWDDVYETGEIEMTDYIANTKLLRESLKHDLRRLESLESDLKANAYDAEAICKAMMNLPAVWEQLTVEERKRLCANLAILGVRVVFYADRIAIELHTPGPDYSKPGPKPRENAVRF